MRSFRWLEAGLQAVLAIGGAMLVIVLTLQVVLRYLFEAPLFGIEELARLVAMWLYFIAATYAVAVNGHICSDLLNLVRLSAPALRRLNAALSALSLAASLLIAWYAGHYAWWVAQSGELTPGLWWPRYWLVGASAVGGLGMAVASLWRLYHDLARCASDRGEGSAS